MCFSLEPRTQPSLLGRSGWTTIVLRPVASLFLLIPQICNWKKKKMGAATCHLARVLASVVCSSLAGTCLPARAHLGSERSRRRWNKIGIVFSYYLRVPDGRNPLLKRSGCFHTRSVSVGMSPWRGSHAAAQQSERIRVRFLPVSYHC